MGWGSGEGAAGGGGDLTLRVYSPLPEGWRRPNTGERTRRGSVDPTDCFPPPVEVVEVQAGAVEDGLREVPGVDLASLAVGEEGDEVWEGSGVVGGWRT